MFFPLILIYTRIKKFTFLKKSNNLVIYAFFLIKKLILDKIFK